MRFCSLLRCGCLKVNWANRQNGNEVVQKLKELLEFEFEANQEAAKKHPATLALAKAVKSMQGPAVITVVSSVDDDSGALLMALERLTEKGYSTVMVGTERNTQF
jgi:hypothetical protein